METDPHDEIALRRNQKQRLKDKAEALLQAFEALEPPQTYAEADRAAKALMSINRALDQIHGTETETADAPSGGAIDHIVMPDALKPVYAGIYRRLARIDASAGRSSDYARLADSLDAELASGSP